MTVGAPDYGITQGQVNETQSADNLELASRLNAIAAINRAGQQIISICESIVYGSGMWYTDAYGSYCMPSLKFANYNRPSLKCVSAANANSYVGLNFNALPFGSHQIGHACYAIAGSFACDLFILLTLVTNQTAYSSGIRINLNNGQVLCLNQGNSYSVIGTYPVPNSDGEPLMLKYTVNFDTMKYGTLFYASETTTDLTSYVPYKTTMAVPDLAMIQQYIFNQSATSNNIYMQDSIITINEVV